MATDVDGGNGSVAFVWANTGGTEPVWQGLFSMLLLLGVAAFLGTVAEHLRQSAVVGYLLAGTLVGPHALGLIADHEALQDVAELGVALLLFAIGLEFSVHDLLRLGRPALRAGAMQIAVTLTLATLIGLLVLPWRAAFVVGAMVSMSSTACVLRVLTDRAELDSPTGKLSLAILLLQDVAVVPLMLAVSLLNRGGSWTGALSHLAVVLVSGGALVLLLHLVFSYLAPPLFAFQARYRNRDLPILLAVVLALGSAWTAHSVGFSPAMGAFIAGALLAVSPFANQVRADVGPVKTTLVTLFFATVGMFGDPRWLVQHVALVTVVAVAVIGGKTLVTALAARWTGTRWRFAVATGVALAQIGEFSFVLATIAHQGGGTAPILGDTTFRAIVSATIITLLVTPYAISLSGPVGVWMERLVEPRMEAGASPVVSVKEESLPVGAAPVAERSPAVVIVGFGPAGQRVAEDLLAAHWKQLVVVDLNPENLAVAQRYALRTVLGDATQREILEHAGIQGAAAVVVTIPTPNDARTVIQLVRHECPGTLILARARYHVFRWALVHAGAHVVVDEEDGMGHTLAQKLLEALRQPTADDREGLWENGQAT